MRIVVGPIRSLAWFSHCPATNSPDGPTNPRTTWVRRRSAGKIGRLGVLLAVAWFGSIVAFPEGAAASDAAPAAAETPLVLQLRGTLPLPAESVDGLEVAGNVAYVIVGSYSNLITVDVGNPARPVELGRYTIEGGGRLGWWQDGSYRGSQHFAAGSFMVEGSEVLVLLTGWTDMTPWVMSMSAAASVEFIDCANPRAPVRRDLFRHSDRGQFYASVFGGPFFYVAGRRFLPTFFIGIPSESQFFVFTRAAGKALLVAQTTGFSDAVTALDWTFDGKDALNLGEKFVTGGAKGGKRHLVLVDRGNPIAPVVVATDPGLPAGDWNYEQLAVDGDILFAAAGTNGVRAFRLSSNPASIVPVATYEATGTSRSVRLDDRRAFIANDPGGVRVLDIRDPAHAALLGDYPCRAMRLDVTSNLVCVLEPGRLLVLEVATDPAHPPLLIRRVPEQVTVATFAGSGVPGNADGPPRTASFDAPNGGAFDQAGNLYLADTGNHRIRRVAPGGTVSTFAGSGSPGFADGPAPASQFAGPLGVGVDVAGNVVVADTGNNRIRKIDSGGVVRTLAGSGVRGYRDGPAAEAQFDYPNDLVVDGAGNLYVTEFNNHTVRRVSPDGTVTTLVGDGSAGSTDGALADGRMTQPGGLAIDHRGDLYVTEWGGQRVRRIEPTAGIIRTLAGVQAGYIDESTPHARMRQPDGIAVDPLGWVYITDHGNHAIRRMSQQGSVETVAGNGTAGFADGTGAEARFDGPGGLAIDASGELYVTDTGNHRVRRVSLRRSPVLLTAPQSAAGVAGTAARLSVRAMGTPPPRYQWYRNEAPLAGATNPVLTWSALAWRDAGSYSLTVSNASGTVTSESVSLTVLPAGDAALTWVPREGLPGGPYPNRKIVDLRLRGDHAYLINKGLIDTDLQPGLQVLNVSNPARPVPLGFVKLPLSNLYLPSVFLDVAGDHAFVSLTDNHVCCPSSLSRLDVIDVSDPSRPRIVRSQSVPEPGNPPGERTVRAYGQWAYLAGDNFQVWEVSDPAAPRVLATLPLAGTRFDTDGRYGYLAGTEFRVLDLSDPRQPILRGTLPLNSFPVAALRVAGTRVYLATPGGLGIVDVQQPSRPAWVGNVADAPAYDLRVADRTAYVLGQDAALRIYDLSAPDRPVLLGAPFGITGHAALPLEAAGQGFDVQAGRACLGKYFGHSLSSDRALYGFELLDVSRPTQVVSVVNCRASMARAVRHFLGQVMLADEGLRVVDLANPAGPTSIVDDRTILDFDELKPWRKGALIHSVAGAGPQLHLLNFNGPTHPVMGWTYPTPAPWVAGPGGSRDPSGPTPWVRGFCAGGDYAGVLTAVALYGSQREPWRFDVLRLDSVAMPTLVGGTTTNGGPAQAIGTDGRLAYVVAGRRLRVFDYQYPASPRLVGSTPAAADGTAFAVGDRQVYLAFNTNEVEMFEVIRPEAPGSVGRLRTTYPPTVLRAAGRLLFALEPAEPYPPVYLPVRDSTALIEVFDLADPSKPKQLGTYRHTGQAYDLEVVGNRMLIADGWRALSIVEIEPPSELQVPDEALLRQALARGDTVRLGFDGTLILDAPLVIDRSVVLDATGHQVTLSGHQRSRIFEVRTNVQFTLKGVTVTDGRSDAGGGLWNGGGIVTLLDCVFRGNQAAGVAGTNGPVLASGASVAELSVLAGGAGRPGFGGAIFNAGTLIASNCTFLANEAAGGLGGTGGRVPASPYTVYGSNGDGIQGAGGAGGRAAGGAIFHESGWLRAVQCLFATNTAEGGTGGSAPAGVANTAGPGGPGGPAEGGAVSAESGQLEVSASRFDGNVARAGQGGAVDFLSPAPPSTVLGGTGGAGGTARGGDVFTRAESFVVGSRFERSIAMGGKGGSGGGIGLDAWPCNGGSGPVPGWGGAGGPAAGGSLYGEGPLRFEEGSVVGATVQGGRGGKGAGGNGAVHQVCGAVGFLSAGADGGPGGRAAGGALFLSGSNQVRNATLAGNFARGGSGGDGGPGGSYSGGLGQFPQFGGSGGRGGHASGGAIESTASDSRLDHLTVALNGAESGSGGPGGAGGRDDAAHQGPVGPPGESALGGGIRTSAGRLVLGNSLVADNNPAGNFVGSVFDDGHNLSSDDSLPLDGPGSRTGVDPRLASLGDYGGPTPTLPPLEGSPLLDAASSSDCPGTDQRGVARPVGAGCDIGAYEGPPLGGPRVQVRIDAPSAAVGEERIVEVEVSNPNASLTLSNLVARLELPAGVELVGSSPVLPVSGLAPGVTRRFPFTIRLRQAGDHVLAVTCSSALTASRSAIEATRLLGTAMPEILTAWGQWDEAGAPTLRGLILPNGPDVRAWFEYGPSAELGSVSAPETLPASFSPTSLSAILPSVPPGTGVHYRTVASRGNSTTHGPIRVLPPMRTLTACTAEVLAGEVATGGYLRFACDGKIALPQTLRIARDLVLDARGRNVLLDGHETVRVLEVTPGTELTLLHVDVANGRSSESGAGLANRDGVVRIIDAWFRSNRVVGATGAPGQAGGNASGGAVYNQGFLYLENSRLEDSWARGGDAPDGGTGGRASGGALHHESGMAVLWQAVLARNKAVGGLGSPGGEAAGGGIYHALGRLYLDGSVLDANLAAAGAGVPGLWGSWPMVPARTTGGNGGTATGGGLAAQDPAQLMGVLGTANRVVGGDGGNAGGINFITGERSYGSAGDGGNARGAALHLARDALVVNCTLATNVALPGIGGRAVSTAPPIGNPGSAQGGGVLAAGGTVDLRHATLADNRADQGLALGALGGSLHLANSVVTGTNGPATAPGVPVLDLGGNVASDANFGLVALSSRSGLDPLLVPLADNGGPTWTMALASNSPAIDAGLAAFAPRFDARGLPRPPDLAPDSGAYEHQRAVNPPPPSEEIDENTLFQLPFEDSLTAATGETPTTARGITFEEGMAGLGARFDAGDELIYDATGNIRETEGTLEFWMKPAWEAGDNFEHGFVNWATGNGAVFSKDGANVWRSTFNRWGLSARELGAYLAVSSTHWRAGEWHHLAFTWRSSIARNSSVCRLYLDGKLLRTQTDAVVIHPPTADARRLRLGGEAGQEARAVLDNLRISGIERSAEEIAASYQRGVTSAAPRFVRQPESQSHVVGTTATLGVEIAGISPRHLQWFKDGTLLSAATNSTLILSEVRLADAGQYWAVMTNHFGSATSHLAVIVVTSPVRHVPEVVTVTRAAGTGTAGPADGPAGEAQFREPNGGFVDRSGNVYIADAGNHRIRKLAPDGLVSTLAGTGEAGDRDGAASDSRFNHPLGVTVDAAGVVYVADTGNHRIRRISADGLQVTTVAGNGTPGYRDGLGTNAWFAFPNDLVADPSGHLFVTEFDNHTVRRITPDGQVSTWVGNGQPGYADGPRTEARLDQPGGIAIDAAGALYLAEWGGRRIRAVSSDGWVSTLAGTGIEGYLDGPWDAARFRSPDGIVADAIGDLYVTDNGNQVVRRISHGQVETVAGTGEPGVQDGPSVLARFLQPTGIGTDGKGTFYVTDAGSHTIRRLVVPPLRVSVSRNPDGSLTVAWSGSSLETADTVDGPWRLASTGSSPWRIPWTGPAAFFRARR